MLQRLIKNNLCHSYSGSRCLYVPNPKLIKSQSQSVFPAGMCSRANGQHYRQSKLYCKVCGNFEGRFDLVCGFGFVFVFETRLDNVVQASLVLTIQPSFLQLQATMCGVSGVSHQKNSICNCSQFLHSSEETMGGTDDWLTFLDSYLSASPYDFPAKNQKPSLAHRKLSDDI